MSTIHLIRHAKAKNRTAWEDADHVRPLTKRGRREANTIAERLGEEGLGRLVSSPFVRCLQTLEPLAVALDLPIETTDGLAEGADGTTAAELLVSLAEPDGPIAACTHGDVVFAVMDVVAGAGVTLDGPRVAPVASIWVLTVEEGRFVGARYVEQPPR